MAPSSLRTGGVPRSASLLRLLTLTAGLTLPAISSVSAADRIWFGENGLFDVADNWSPTGVPTTDDNAILNAGVATIEEGDDLFFNYLRITRGASPADASASVIQTGGTVSTSNVRVGDGNSHTGALELWGTASMTVRAGSGSILIGANAGSTGTMVVKDSAFFENLGTSNYRFVVGDTGTGTLSIQDQATVFSSRLSVATNPLGVGTLEVSGESNLSVTENLTIGNGGQGVATISDSAAVTAGTVNFGAPAGTGTGNLHLNGGSVTANNFIKAPGSTATVHFNGGVVKAAALSVDFFQGFDAADLQVEAGGLRFDTNGNQVLVTQSFSGSGSLTKLGEGTLELLGGAGYGGDTIVEGGTLSIWTASLSDTGSVFLWDGTLLDLSFTGTDTIGALLVDGEALAIGTWGGVGSGADNISEFLTGGGILNVTAVPEPRTFALVAMGIAFGAWGLRRRQLS